MLPKKNVRKSKLAVKVWGKNLRRYVPPMRIAEMMMPVQNPVITAFLIENFT